MVDFVVHEALEWTTPTRSGEASGSRKRKWEAAGFPESANSFARHDGEQNRLLAFDILVQVGLGCRKGSNQVNTRRRRKVRGMIWQHLGYALYATIRTRPDWDVEQLHLH